MNRTCAVALLLSAGAVAYAQTRTPVVVELFTSEGCSSCPPADRLLSQIDRNSPAGVKIIALSEHVDYWDQLGWRDRFSSPLFSARQEEYGRVFRVESVYTPQMVLNGQAQCLGSDATAFGTALRAVVKSPRARVDIANSTRDHVVLRADHLPPDAGESEILLAIAEDGLSNFVERGENGGRRLQHTAVVRSLTRLGTLDPKKNGAYTGDVQLNLRSDWNRSNVKLVLLVQDRKTREILGASSVRLR